MPRLREEVGDGLGVVLGLDDPGLPVVGIEGLREADGSTVVLDPDTALELSFELRRFAESALEHQREHDRSEREDAEVAAGLADAESRELVHLAEEARRGW